MYNNSVKCHKLSYSSYGKGYGNLSVLLGIKVPVVGLSETVKDKVSTKEPAYFS